MKTSSANTRRALTLIEALIVKFVLGLLAAILLPALGKAKVRGGPSCVNYLKQIGLSFQIWAGDNGGKYPMQVSVASGGTRELVESGVVFPHFQVMSNELNTPRILFCQSEYDSKKIKATAFDTNDPYTAYGRVLFTGDKNISYFIGVDATQTNSQMFLAGDRNITNSLKIKSGMLRLTADQPAGWTDKMHNNQGNVLLTDGSVQQFSTSGLRNALGQTGFGTNRLALP